MRSPQTRSHTAGFTLAEMLVAMALLAVLAAAVVPSILNQVNKGEVNRLVQDLKGVGNATRLYYSDVQRWPRGLSSLTVKPTSDTTDIAAEKLSNLSDRWSGPYLEKVVNDSLPTAFGGHIRRSFTKAAWTAGGTDTFMVLNVSGVAESDFRKVSKVIDNDTLAGAGAVRYDATSKIMTYFATPKNVP